MASVSPGPSSGGKRELNSEVNLVPFVDLLSVCICFLLMTAVWLQISALQVKQSHGTEAPPQKEESYEIAFKFQAATKGLMEFKRGSTKIGSFAIEGQDKAQFVESFQSTLESQIAKLFPNRQPTSESPLIETALITPSDAAPYSSLIAVMDVLRRHEIVNLAVTPAGLTKPL